MKTRIKSFLERRRQLIESMSAPIVLTLVVLLVIASSISANTTNQQPQQAASAITNLASQPAPKPLPLQASQQEMSNSQASSEASPAQQASETQQANSAAANTVQSNTNQMGAGVASAAPPRLPKINIYASRSEVKKLLGIDTSINYVTNGQLNLYPLGFTIPMGYHLSDMIFTWQNLGTTNVNYSISLVIGNIQAVERPLINITRSGLIPRHEQVFKITLPCSGKLTDDVDVQVLINITGQVPASDERDGANIGAAGDDDDAQTNSDLQMARAVHQQQNENLMSSNLINQTGGEQMQADETAAPRRAAAMRQVSHTIAIKRKKICTMHPVPVTPAPRPAPVWPPNQAPSTTGTDSTKFQPTPSASSLPGAPQVSQNSANQQANNNNKQPERPIAAASTPPPPASSSSRPIGQWQPPSGGDQSAPEPPAHQPSWSVTAPSAPRLEAPQAGAGLPARQLPQFSWPDAVRHTNGAPSLPPAPPANEPIINPLHPRLLAPNVVEYPTNQQANALNPLLFTLILMALIISAALVALLVIGTASSSSSLRRHPLDKLNALTNCLFRRTGGSRAQTKCTKAGHSPVISSSSLVVGPNLTIKQGGFGTMGGFGPHSRAHHAMLGAGIGSKSAVSSLSGLSTDSGPQHQQHQLGKQQAGLYYYTKQQQQQQTNYSPYYHHYQCPPDLLIGANQSGYSASHSTSPYHITMSNQQTTKLFLGANGATGYAVDNNYTITPPTTLGHNHHQQQQQQQARSDSSSVYQTIY